MAVRTGPIEINLLDWTTRQQKSITLPTKTKIVQGMDSTYHALFSPDGKWLATGAGFQQPLCLWDVATGKEMRRIDCPASVSAFSPDGKLLAVVSSTHEDGRQRQFLHLWEVATGKEVFHLPIQGEEFHWWIDFSPDGKTIAWVSTERISLRDSRTGKELLQLPGSFRTAYFSPDGRTLVTTSGNRIQVWDPATGKERFERPGHSSEADAFACSPDGRTVVTASWVEGLRFWDAVTGRQLCPPVHERHLYVRNLAFTADSRTVLSGHSEGFIRSWDARSGKLLRTLDLVDPKQPQQEWKEFKSFLLPAAGPKLATLERRLDQGRETSRVAAWDAATGRLLSSHHLTPAQHAVWTPDGQIVIFGTADGLTSVQAENGRVRFQVPVKGGGPLSVSPDGRLVAGTITIPQANAGTNEAKGETTAVRVWELATGTELATVSAGPGDAPVLPPDNRTLVTRDSRSLRVWDLATGKELLRRLLPEDSSVLGGNSYGQQLCLSANGRRAITRQGDGTLLVWDLLPAAGPARFLTKPLEPKEWAGLWADLAEESAVKAYHALWKMTEEPEPALAWLRKNLKPTLNAEPGRVAQLLKDLDHDQFAVRESAVQELKKLGSSVEAAVRKTLAAQPSVEGRRRLEQLLTDIEEKSSPAELQALRALQIVERIGTAAARALLAELAQGKPETRVTQAARLSLERFEQRSGIKTITLRRVD